MHRHRKAAFTLVELLGVIVVMASFAGQCGPAHGRWSLPRSV